jgi:hypothetical protein
MGKYFIYSTDVLYAKNVKNQVIKSNPPNMRKKMGLKKEKKKKKKKRNQPVTNITCKGKSYCANLA